MKLRTAADLLRSGQAGALLSLSRLTPSYYRVCFLGTAAATGLLRRLSPGAASLDQLARELATPAARDGLQAWLDFGVSLGLLRRTRGGYTLHGRLSRTLADPAYDPMAALFEEIATLHHRWIAETPLRLREARPFSLDELQADLVARSSLTLAPFVREAVQDVVRVRGPVRLLEVGCGSGLHIRTAAERNPELRAIGVDIAPAAVALARDNIRAWGLEDRVQIEEADVRLRAPDGAFDLVTLHNNIYYFPVDRRTALLAHVRGFLRRGGRLLLTTAVRGGSPTTELLNLWGAMTAGCGRLPEREELAAQLRDAGFASVRPRRLIPGERIYSFVATA
jgi:4-hydroxy-2,2'-bipyrrole-5-carbaldehyde O-methyltransferase